jgi:hypothetical protein
MLVTLQPKDKNDTKRVFSLSPKQLLALGYERFDTPDNAKAALGVQWTQVVKSMLDNDTFTANSKGVYRRTALGTRLLKLLESQGRA